MSKAWLRRHVSDAYVRRAKAQGYRSRAAYKLLQIDEEHRILRPGGVILDLGSAPGSWSQVAAQKVKPGGRVTAVDLLEMAPIPGVTFRRGDFRDAAFDAGVDVVLCDVSPNISGIRDADEAKAVALVEQAAELARTVLAPRGAFLVKVFHGARFPALLEDLKRRFRSVQVVKPGASRSESRETYLLARSPKVE